MGGDKTMGDRETDREGQTAGKKEGKLKFIRLLLFVCHIHFILVK